MYITNTFITTEQYQAIRTWYQFFSSGHGYRWERTRHTSRTMLELESSSVIAGKQKTADKKTSATIAVPVTLFGQNINDWLLLTISKPLNRYRWNLIFFSSIFYSLRTYCRPWGLFIELSVHLFPGSGFGWCMRLFSENVLL